MPSTPSRRPQRGVSLFSLMLILFVTTVALGSMVQLTAVSTIAARRARVQTDARMAATAVANDRRVTNGETGGAVAPAAPVAKFFDDVTVNAESGALEPAGERPDPKLTRLRRQWSVRDVEDGHRIVEVSAEVVDANGQSLPETSHPVRIVVQRYVR